MNVLLVRIRRIRLECLNVDVVVIVMLVGRIIECLNVNVGLIVFNRRFIEDIVPFHFFLFFND